MYLKWTCLNTKQRDDVARAADEKHWSTSLQSPLSVLQHTPTSPEVKMARFDIYIHVEQEGREKKNPRDPSLCATALARPAARRPSHPWLQMILASYIELHPDVEHTAANVAFVSMMLSSSVCPLLLAETVAVSSDSSRADAGIVYEDHWMRCKIGQDVSVGRLERYVLSGLLPHP